MLFPPGSLPDGPKFEQRKALVLLDLQNDFVSPEGKLYAPNSASFLAKIPDLVKRFRDRGEVVWTRTEFREPCSILSPEIGGYCILLKQFINEFSNIPDDQLTNDGVSPKQDDIESCDAEQADPAVELDPEAFLAVEIPRDYERCCLPGSYGAEYPEILQPAMQRHKDLIATKSHYSAFTDMAVLMQLRTRLVTELYICGSLSNISVYATALDAVRNGFQVTVVEDCLGYRDESCHIQAMRRMADNMGVEGVDCQELMDDLAGLLGDVVKEENFPTRFEVDTSRPSLAEKRNRSAQNIKDWFNRTQQTAATPADDEPLHARPISSSSISSDESSNKIPPDLPSPVPESSPPRKRSVNDVDGELEVSRHIRTSQQTWARRSSHDAYVKPEARGKKTKVRVRRRKDIQDKFESQKPAAQESLSTGDIPNVIPPALSTNANGVDISSPMNPKGKRLNKKSSSVFLTHGDPIGDGSSKIVHDVLDYETAQRAFESLKLHTVWQKMYHRTGEVPRLVAVQGDVIELSLDNTVTYPIYRHPADESPKLYPFEDTVNMLRKVCEKHVGHPLNHVLIQHYRHGEDNISEHSDKTLDIVKGTNIVNLSLGAMRTMTLRTKKSNTAQTTVTTATEPGTQRLTQRVQLPHASLFVLSLSTNAKFLHAIRADKRLQGEKSAAELDFGGQRISLTFRHIGTYITDMSDGSQLIWGQGATGKKRCNAREILNSNGAAVSKQENAHENESKSKVGQEMERMIIAFGKENHEGENFDWEEIYGQGFDVVNFTTKTAEVES